MCVTSYIPQIFRHVPSKILSKSQAGRIPVEIFTLGMFFLLFCCFSSEFTQFTFAVCVCFFVSSFLFLLRVFLLVRQYCNGSNVEGSASALVYCEGGWACHCVYAVFWAHDDTNSNWHALRSHGFANRGWRRGAGKQEQIGILGKHILMESLEMFSFIIRVLIFLFYFLDGFKLKCLGVIIQDVDVSNCWVNFW